MHSTAIARPTPTAILADPAGRDATSVTSALATRARSATESKRRRPERRRSDLVLPVPHRRRRRRGRRAATFEVCGPCSYTAQMRLRPGVRGWELPARCQAGQCPGEGICDVLGVGGYGADLCLPCVTAADCSDGLGCNQATHVIGTCLSPNRRASPLWKVSTAPRATSARATGVGGQTGILPLTNCDLRSCPASQPLCEVVPSLSTDHRYCVACLHDSDCADAGPGAWCDVSVKFRSVASRSSAEVSSSDARGKTPELAWMALAASTACLACHASESCFD